VNRLGLADTRLGVLEPPGAVLRDAATQLLYSDGATERLGHRVFTGPTAALPINYSYETGTRVDTTQQTVQRGVETELSVGPLPEAFGVKYDGS